MSSLHVAHGVHQVIIVVMTDTSNPLDPLAKPLPVRQRLQTWFGCYLGGQLLASEQHILEQILPDLFGYHFVQMGLLHDRNLLEISRISHGIVVQLDDESVTPGVVTLQSVPESLPFESESVDVVVLPHVLEFSANPHKILREVERVLIGEGHLVIIGFNPWSLFGLWRLLLAWRDEPPWSGHFFSLHRLRDWFTLLDFEVVHSRRFFYRPPLGRPGMMQKLGFLEKLGSYCWSFFGGIYVVVVRKHVLSLTPVKDMWLKRRSMIKSGIVEPTTRNTGS